MEVLSELFIQTGKLQQLLEPYEDDILDCCKKPLREMSISEKVKLAKFILKIRRGTP